MIIPDHMPTKNLSQPRVRKDGYVTSIHIPEEIRQRLRNRLAKTYESLNGFILIAITQKLEMDSKRKDLSSAS